jgi:hypothetical protein
LEVLTEAFGFFGRDEVHEGVTVTLVSPQIHGIVKKIVAISEALVVKKVQKMFAFVVDWNIAHHECRQLVVLFIFVVISFEGRGAASGAGSTPSRGLARRKAATGAGATPRIGFAVPLQHGRVELHLLLLSQYLSHLPNRSSGHAR